MIKASDKITEKQLFAIIDKIPLRSKLRLVRKLERETRKARWNELFRIIGKNLKKHPITQKDINKEIAAVRKARNAKGRS